MDRRKLSDAEITEGLLTVEGWTITAGKLHREFVFKDFKRAFSFMTGVALIAEQLDHHPEWSNVYNRVAIDLVTHDVKGISPFDFEFARRVGQLQA